MTEAEIKAEAARWLIEIETTADPATAWPAFEAWLRQDEEHRRAYERVERAWRTLEGLKSFYSAGALPSAAGATAGGPGTKQVRRKSRAFVVVVVVTIAAIAAIAAAAFFRQ
jgi:ferric-dicitrate binding protein FerR (iron transport regulator)